ncbi:unnamed protein product [Paramecium primaurelia]|uniref:Uncharacterized protein n=1 Tax=Paramecium primaurelia TaxID=5886 RepID=A0A8S1PKX1_PARPR|nr:unnamed protein product [Paramecium primaurelia]
MKSYCKQNNQKCKIRQGQYLRIQQRSKQKIKNHGFVTQHYCKALLFQSSILFERLTEDSFEQEILKFSIFQKNLQKHYLITSRIQNLKKNKCKRNSLIFHQIQVRDVKLYCLNENFRIIIYYQNETLIYYIENDYFRQIFNEENHSCVQNSLLI